MGWLLFPFPQSLKLTAENKVFVHTSPAWPCWTFLAGYSCVISFGNRVSFHQQHSCWSKQVGGAFGWGPKSSMKSLPSVFQGNTGNTGNVWSWVYPAHVSYHIGLILPRIDFLDGFLCLKCVRHPVKSDNSFVLTLFHGWCHKSLTSRFIFSSLIAGVLVGTLQIDADCSSTSCRGRLGGQNEKLPSFKATKIGQLLSFCLLEIRWLTRT